MAHWPRADILALLGIVATVVIALIPPVRAALARLANRIWFELGFPARRYRRRFNERYRWLENVYLDKKERLDLGGSYVALSAVGGSAGPQNRTIATTVLADRDNHRLIITGAPGSGKSTLLKAYALGTTRARKRVGDSADLLKIGHAKEIPFFVQLRRLTGSVWDHLVEEILVSECGFQRPAAEKFLRRLLVRHRCLVLLDGLDEVPDDRYQEVRGTILHFIDDRNPERDTANARAVLTCRRQNFSPEEWTSFAEVEHVLTPMQDTEILSFLTNRRADFADKGLTPERFFTAIEGSATFDLHRTPLVLAMSVGLYLDRRIDAVPNSISDLYGAMIRTMLDRHKFIPDGAPVNVFTRDDKERFLQRFALAMAERPHAFQDFTGEELLAEARKQTATLSRVRSEQAQAFVDEIVHRSGLLTQIAPGNYTFAHRSIQEYLIAAQLRDREPQGADLLLARASDREWQQVALFFAAGHTAVVEDFLTRLYTLHPELAIRCLANVETQNVNELARRMLREFTAETLAAPDFDQIVPDRLRAVLFACRAVSEPVREDAVLRALEMMRQIGPDRFAEVVGGDDNLIRVLADLVGTNADDVAVLVPLLAESIPDDPRIVPVLWRCLHVLDRVSSAAQCRHLVARLLTLAMDEPCFAVLEAQPRLRSTAITAQLRRQAYPFEEALPVETSNLVTLLAWAELLDTEIEKPNLFLKAKDAGPRYFANLERDNRRTIRLRPYVVGVMVSAVIGALAAANVLRIGLTRPSSFFEPYGQARNTAMFAGVILFSILLAALLDNSIRILRISGDDKHGGVGLWLSPLLIRMNLPTSVLYVLVFGMYPGLLAMGLIDLLWYSWWVYLLAGPIAVYLGYWFFFTDPFDPGVVYTLNKRNGYVDAYSDPASAHWLRKPAEPVP